MKLMDIDCYFFSIERNKIRWNKNNFIVRILVVKVNMFIVICLLEYLYIVSKKGFLVSLKREIGCLYFCC